jgi:hypothetical protein
MSFFNTLRNGLALAEAATNAALSALNTSGVPHIVVPPPPSPPTPSPGLGAAIPEPVNQSSSYTTESIKMNDSEPPNAGPSIPVAQPAAQPTVQTAVQKPPQFVGPHGLPLNLQSNFSMTGVLNNQDGKLIVSATEFELLCADGAKDYNLTSWRGLFAWLTRYQRGTQISEIVRFRDACQELQASMCAPDTQVWFAYRCTLNEETRKYHTGMLAYFTDIQAKAQLNIATEDWHRQFPTLTAAETGGTYDRSNASGRFVLEILEVQEDELVQKQDTRVARVRAD